VLQQCDLNSKASLAKALDGAYGFYAFTNYFEHKIEGLEDLTEVQEGKAMADVAKESGIKHYIWSTLPEYKEYSKGKYKSVHHFDGKYEVEQYVRTLGFEIASYVAPSCYLQNFMGSGTHRVPCVNRGG
jgi:NmrA-like family